MLVCNNLTFSDYQLLKQKALSIVPPSIIFAKGDSGASGHYLRKNDAKAGTHHTTTNGPSVELPHGSTMQSNEKCLLLLPTCLSTQARTAHIFDNLKSASLISLGQLCDDDCEIWLHKHGLQVFKNNKQNVKIIRRII